VKNRYKEENAPIRHLWEFLNTFAAPHPQGWRRKDGVTVQITRGDITYVSSNVEDIGEPHVVDSSEWEGSIGRFSYQINSDGFVGTEFHKDPDILALGCSITASCGLPHEYTWPHLIANKTGKKVNVLAYPGSGIARCVNNLFPHMAMYGKPKAIYALIPDLERLSIQSLRRDRKPEDQVNKWHELNLNWDSDFGTYMDPETFQSDESGRTYRKPIDYRDVTGKRAELPIDVGITNNINALFILKFACKVMDIDLRMAMWHPRTVADFIQSRHPGDFMMDKFVSSTYRQSIMIPGPEDEYVNNECHSPIHPLQTYLWDEADDRPHGHPGLHAHLHYAEMFGDEPFTADDIRKVIQGPRIAKK
jgi:hypothetical protein